MGSPQAFGAFFAKVFYLHLPGAKKIAPYVPADLVLMTNEPMISPQIQTAIRLITFWADPVPPCLKGVPFFSPFFVWLKHNP